MLIRPADPALDAERCAEIYAPSVDGSVASFEETAPGPSEIARRIGAVHLWMVAELEGRVVGFAYGGEHRSRRAYRWTTEVSVYIDAAAHRRGVGRALYEALFDELRGRGFQLAVAGITLPNDASVGLHRAIGFESAGVYRRVGWKDGAWWDVSWWQLELIPAGQEQPPEPQFS